MNKRGFLKALFVGGLATLAKPFRAQGDVFNLEARRREFSENLPWGREMEIEARTVVPDISFSELPLEVQGRILDITGLPRGGYAVAWLDYWTEPRSAEDWAEFAKRSPMPPPEQLYQVGDPHPTEKHLGFIGYCDHGHPLWANTYGDAGNAWTEYATLEICKTAPEMSCTWAESHPAEVREAIRRSREFWQV